MTRGIAWAAPTTVTVAQDGSGQYTTIAAALDANKTVTGLVVNIAPGTYREKLAITATDVTFAGTGTPQDTVLVFGDSKNTVGSTSASASVQIAGDGFTAQNLTFANDSKDRVQAVAVRTTGDRARFTGVRFTGWQDTLFLDGKRAHLTDCTVEGAVDMIFGSSSAVFEKCTIHSVADSGGAITAPSTREGRPGFLFLGCTFTSDGESGLFLGRPWVPSSDPLGRSPQTVVRECELGAHIAAAPWTDMSGNKWQDARFAEYKNTGPGAGASGPNRPEVADPATATAAAFLDGWT